MEPGTLEQFKNLVYQKRGSTLGPRKVSLVSACIARLDCKWRADSQLHMRVWCPASLTLTMVQSCAYRNTAP